MDDEGHMIGRGQGGIAGLVSLPAASQSRVVLEDIPAGIKPEAAKAVRRGRGRPASVRNRAAFVLPGIRRLAEAMPDAKLETVVRCFVIHADEQGFRLGASTVAAIWRITKEIRRLDLCWRRPPSPIPEDDTN
jgi:hypothetical protein